VIFIISMLITGCETEVSSSKKNSQSNSSKDTTIKIDETESTTEKIPKYELCLMSKANNFIKEYNKKNRDNPIKKKHIVDDYFLRAVIEKDNYRITIGDGLESYWNSIESNMSYSKKNTKKFFKQAKKLFEMMDEYDAERADSIISKLKKYKDDGEEIHTKIDRGDGLDYSFSANKSSTDDWNYRIFLDEPN